MTELPTGTLTFLFTDIEGSTRLLQSGIAVVMDELAALALREADPSAAMRLAGAASELAATTGTSFAVIARGVPEYRAPDRETAPAGNTDLLAAWDEGRAMTVEEAIAYALQRQAPI